MASKLFNTLRAINWSHGQGDLQERVRYIDKAKSHGFVLRTIPVSQYGRSPAQRCHFTILARKTGKRVKFLGHIRKIA